MPRKRVDKNAPVTRRSGRTRHADENPVPAVYREMLVEAARSSPMRSDGEGRTIKRRRLGEHLSHKVERDVPKTSSEVQSQTEDDDGLDELFEDVESGNPQQMIYEDFGDSDEDDDEDEEFEDVDLQNIVTSNQEHNKGDLNISLQPVKSEKARTTPRRKPVSKLERRLRLDVHKLHLLCLLGHVRCRSDWCNDLEIQGTLKSLLPRKIIKLLHVDEDQPQYQRTHSWTKGIEECCRIWEQHFEITTKGLRRAWWREDTEKGLDFNDLDASDNLSDKDDFKQAARTQAGSRDVGAQLFCALLRSVAVDTRLVGSLQVLPFSGVAKGMTPEKPKSEYIFATDLQPKADQDEGNNTDSSVDFSNPRRRIGQPQFPAPGIPVQRSSPAPRKKRKIVDSPFPIFWVEAFNEAAQKWIPLDPIVRHTINKPKTGFEPPASDRLNNMSYVIAFEEEGTARDVTLRYARHFNAKTRKTRIESTKGGVSWWKKTISFFEKPYNEARDEIEDAELAAREAAEEMPRNVQDFKDHPHYALERHLRRNEAIWPLQEVGKVSPGMGKDAKLEPIYRRQDVHIVRSADQWYRLGRDVKVGEQPLKRATPKRKQAQVFDEMEEDDEDAQEGTRLYAEYQTDIYVPPPVVQGKVPKNAYGNIDIYVPTMIPPDGIHVQHPESARAAKTLGIDFAAAVTGFEFKGRRGTAVVKGIVIAAEYRDALVEVLRCFNDEKARAIEQARTLEALKLWKKLLVGLRIKERIKEYEEKDDNTTPESKSRGKPTVTANSDDDSEDADYVESPNAGGGGGFFASDDDKDDTGGGFIPDPATAGGFTPEETSPPIREPDLTISSRVEQTLSSIDLDAGIIITESPHTRTHDSEPSKTEILLPTSPSHSKPPAPQKYDIVVQPSTRSSPPESQLHSPPDPSSIPPPSSSKPNNTQLDPPIPDVQKPADEEEGAGGFLRSSSPADPTVKDHDNLNDPRDQGKGKGKGKDIAMDDNEKEQEEDGKGVRGESEDASDASILEKGSLLSEDPDERDADPEWLD